VRASCFVYAGRCVAGPHGITPADRLSTSVVGVSRAKATQAGFPHRGQPLPRKPLRGFGRWTPNIQRHPRHRPMHSLKGIVPEAPAYVSVRLWTAYGGDGGAQSCASTAASTQACDAFDGARLLMAIVQELVSNFCHMTNKQHSLSLGNARRAGSTSPSETMMARNG
jgi:hypothetical protein